MVTILVFFSGLTLRPPWMIPAIISSSLFGSTVSKMSFEPVFRSSSPAKNEPMPAIMPLKAFLTVPISDNPFLSSSRK